MNRKEWLASRLNGIGASEAACIMGLSPYKSNVELWEEKTGRRVAADIGDKPCVKYGKESERHIRALFALDHPEYIVGYDEFGMVTNLEECPWLFATLDGELTELDDSKPIPLIERSGVLEIKTTEIMHGGQWGEWEGRVPQHYYIQILHQLLATGYSFAVLKARIKYHKNGELLIAEREYYFERDEQLESMEILLQKEITFWNSVKSDTRPALILPDI